MIVEARSVEKWYLRGKKDGSNRFFAVQKTDLVLEAGKVTALTGRSGSGKTTLMSMMAGLLSPDGGTILADGADLYSMTDDKLSRFRNQHFGMIPQGAEVLPELTVMENILIPQGIYGDPEEAAFAAAEEHTRALMEKMEILALADVPARELSGGERRRLCIVRALAGSPEVIFADEPTSDLDDANTEIVLTMLREAADAGAAVMIVTHDSAALPYADVRLRMDGGMAETL